MIEQTLGDALRFFREQRGISLRTLAEQTSVSPSFLSQIENGQCSPSISSMEKIANALGVTLGQFFLSANQQTAKVVRASERARLALDWPRAEIASLGSLPDGSHFRASMITIKPGGLTGKPAIPLYLGRVLDGIRRHRYSEVARRRADVRARRFGNNCGGNKSAMAE